MLRLAWLLALLAGCGGNDDSGKVDAAADSATMADTAEFLGTCPTPGREKIKFALPTSCGNDGSVEWCIPDNDAPLMAMLKTISPTITCAPGGGRAQCGGPPARLLCFYPTAYPDQCFSNWGEMKPEVWADMCEIAALPEVVEIVPTIFE